MKTGKKRIAAILVFVFLTMLPLIMPDFAAANETCPVANRYNVVLVIDKSGSLRDERGVGTDPEGLRYDAMKLFLGLLTETGNHVGTVVFDEAIRYDSGLVPINSLDEKKELIRAVEELGTSYDTDIGAAMLRATEMLHGMREENGLPCAILLLTDGMTDFSTGENQWYRMSESREAGKKALQAAQDEGITIHGILLNVEGRAESGIAELRAFTDGTNGQFETVSSPEDLTAAFERFYSIINQTEYSGAHKVIFSDQGEAETGFLVPGYGTEEVNIVIEQGSAEKDGAFDNIQAIHITQPDGSAYDAASHILSTTRFLLIKIPDPTPGTWNVALKGCPGDSVDVCLIYNASMSVALSADRSEEDFRVLEPVKWTAVVADGGKNIGTQRLENVDVLLKVTNLATGEVQDYPMHTADGACECEIVFQDGGDYSFAALVDLIGFEVRSNTVKATVAVPPPVAKRTGVSSLTDVGTVRDNIWALDLNALFEDPKGTGLTYTLSDDCGGAVAIDENGVLRADLSTPDKVSFTVSATDAYGLHAELPFELSIQRPSPRLGSVADMLEDGSFHGDLWEIDLNSLFEGAADNALSYTLSDDLGGAVTIEDGKLRARLPGIENTSFTVKATDAIGLSTELPFTLSIPAPEALVSGVSSLADGGVVRNGVWELDLSALLEDPKGGSLAYTLSDDCGGAVTVDDKGMLRADLAELETASFTVTATDACGLKAELPFDLSIEHPAPMLSGVADTLENGSFRNDVWEVDLDSLFDGKGNALTYALSDDMGGALRIENSILQAQLAGIENASFTVTATDANGLRAEIPFELSVPAPEALVSGVSSLTDAGTVHDGVWELDLNALFEDPKDGGLSYALSDDCGGAVAIDDKGILRADLAELETASFTVTATDAYGLNTELPFDIDIEHPSSKLSGVLDTLENGSFRNDVWEIDLDSLFDGKGNALTYTLSDDLGGAVTIEDGKLRAQLAGIENASFTVTATDTNGLRADLPFELSVPAPEALVSGVSSMTDAGAVHDGVWELDLNALFEDPKGGGFTYALSDDCGGAVAIDDKGILRADLAELETASFTVTATDACGLKAELPVDFDIEHPAPKLSGVADTLENGSFRNDVWEIDLDSLFDGKGSALTYTLSDDLGGAATIEDGRLRAQLAGIENASFTVTATDANGLRADLPFELSVPAPETMISGVSSPTDAGAVHDGVWELDLNALFKDPKGGGFAYALSDDCGGAVAIDDKGILRADLAELETASFTVTATDACGLTAQLPVDFDIEHPAPKLSGVSDTLKNGSFRDDVWEIDLNTLFDSEGSALSYTLSDDLGGAVTIEDGRLRAQLAGIENASFTVTATDANGLRADLPFELSVPAPEALVGGISDTVKTGWFQDDAWELKLDGLFRDPKGSKLVYTLSEDFGGALKIDGDVLRAKCRGIGKADFSVIATDPFGLHAEVPVSLTEKNISWVYAVLSLLAVLVPGAAVSFLRRRAAKPSGRH